MRHGPEQPANDRGPQPPESHVPPGAPAWATPALIAETLDHWQSHFHEILTPEDALEILLNTAHLIDLLEDDGQ